MSRCIQGEVVELHLTVHVDEKTTSQLNTGQDNIDDIIVLHLEGGKDFFVSFNFLHWALQFCWHQLLSCKMLELCCYHQTIVDLSVKVLF